MRTALSTSGSVLGAMLSSVKSPVRKHKERFKNNVSREHLNDTTMGGSAGGGGHTDFQIRFCGSLCDAAAREDRVVSDDVR